MSSHVRPNAIFDELKFKERCATIDSRPKAVKKVRLKHNRKRSKAKRAKK